MEQLTSLSHGYNSDMKQRLYRLLRWSEKYTKTDMIYLTKGGFWLVLGHGIQVTSGLVLAIAFANLLPKESYGTYQFVMALASILSACTLSGMNIAIKRAVARGNDGALRYGFQTQIVWSAGIVLAGGALALYYFVNGNTVLASSFLIVGALSPFIEGFSLFKAYLIGKHKFRESAFLGLWRRPLFIVTMLIALLLTDDPVVLIFVYFATSALSAGLLYSLVVRKYNLISTPDSELKHYSKHLSVMGLVAAVGGNIDKILVWTMLGAAPVAIYTLAMLPVVHLLKLFGIGKDLVFPRFAQRDFYTIRQTIHRKVLIFLILTATTALLYIFSAPYIFKTLFPAYTEAVMYSQIMVLVLLAKPNSLFDQVYASHGMKKVQYFIQITSVLLRVTLLIVLIPLYGLWGTVWTLLGIYTYWSIITPIIFYTRKYASK